MTLQQINIGPLKPGFGTRSIGGASSGPSDRLRGVQDPNPPGGGRRRPAGGSPRYGGCSRLRRAHSKRRFSGTQSILPAGRPVFRVEEGMERWMVGYDGWEG